MVIHIKATSTDKFQTTLTVVKVNVGYLTLKATLLDGQPRLDLLNGLLEILQSCSPSHLEIRTIVQLRHIAESVSGSELLTRTTPCPITILHNAKVTGLVISSILPMETTKVVVLNVVAVSSVLSRATNTGSTTDEPAGHDKVPWSSRSSSRYFESQRHS